MNKLLLKIIYLIKFGYFILGYLNCDLIFGFCFMDIWIGIYNKYDIFLKWRMIIVVIVKLFVVNVGIKEVVVLGIMYYGMFIL